MIQQKTILKITDNSGAKLVKCIKVLKSKNKPAKIGDLIVVSIKKTQNISKNKHKTLKLKKKEVFKAIVITTKFPLRKSNGFFTIFKKNTAVILDKQFNPLATRINSFLPKILKQNKLVSISKTLV